MSTVHARLVESTFGPVEDICQDTTRRAEGSNHHQTGSGGHAVTPDATPDVPDMNAIADLAGTQPRELLDAVHRRVQRDMAWFLWSDEAGETVYSPFSLAVLVTQLITDATADLRAAQEQCAQVQRERDDLMRQVEDLAWDLNDVLSGRGPVSPVGAMFTERQAHDDEIDAQGRDIEVGRARDRQAELDGLELGGA